MMRLNVMLVCLLAMMPAVSTMSLVVDARVNGGPPSPDNGNGGGLEKPLISSPSDIQGALQVEGGPAQPVPEPPTPPPQDSTSTQLSSSSSPSSSLNVVQQQQQQQQQQEETVVDEKKKAEETTTTSTTDNNVEEEKKEGEQQQQQQQQELAQVDCSTLGGPAKNPPPQPIPDGGDQQALAQVSVEGGPPADVDPKRPGVGGPQKKPVHSEEEQQQQVLVQVNGPEGRPVDPKKTGVEGPQKKPLVDDHLSKIIDAQSLVDCNGGPPAPVDPTTPSSGGGL